jgi:hypothetical protein
MKLSEVLWIAANEQLWDGDLRYDNLSEYSCGAVSALISSPMIFSWTFTSTIKFLRELGVQSSCTKQFNEFDPGPERQGARYLWLDFARLVAEDEGL